MSIAKMKLVTLSSDLNKLDPILKKFITLEQFHPIASDQFVDRVRGLKTFSSTNPFKALLDEIIEIEKEFNIELPQVIQDDLECNIDDIHETVVTVHQELRQEVNAIKEIEKEIELYKISLEQVHNLEDLDVSLDDIFSCKFLYTRFGRLPIDSLDKIKYYRNKPFIFKVFNEKDNYIWCMYIATDEYRREIDSLFASLFFERVRIPEFVHGTPEKAEIQLNEHINELQKKNNALKENLTKMKVKCVNNLATTKGELEFQGKLFEAKKYVVGLGERFSITGFVVKDDVDKFIDKFSDIENIDIDVRPASSDKRITPPTKLKNNWFSKPFEMYVEMYGTPSYKDIDPTLIVALTYTLLFGIMFGDFGQGILMSIIGFLLTKYKKMPLGKIITRIGFSSAFFGLIYGSLFGNEVILGQIYQKIGIPSNLLPLHVMSSSVTMNLLIATVAIGAVLILMSIFINIYVKFKNKNYVDGIISSNGVLGFLFYGFILIGLALKLTNIIDLFNPITITLLIVIPLLGIFFKEPLERVINKHKPFPTGFGGFFIEGFFEMFEVMLSYITNTMSFLRVGGFILSHAGMMLVVNKLMEMSGGSGSIIVMILGNLFVMGLEGLIVGIQVLRLEFYEMFSRYYEGDGVPFTPIKF